ncbi:abortive infection family protein [Sphingobacterium hungaricum]|uniref:Abortive infection protein-like C-terminal domain-containing protein n=1 Tax=Sphingobacterium hungaricum TaxID=2082723 RepID=A0A928UXF4_9SPHI|nr:abortive infection family protein [Sphingobacterium hungaricum]MBE8712884.1 hypothetical protein [Sphingobacterium hungaricum]
MKYKVSPKYLMLLISEIEKALWGLFPSSKYKNVLFYIEKWHEFEQGYNFNDNWENFTIFFDNNNNNNIDLVRTLNNIDGDTLIKIAIDLGVNTPDFIPSIPTFRNDIKVNHHSASATFENAFKKIESEPSLAIGLANSALESIIKEILKDERIASKIKSNKTLYDLSSEILKVFQLFPHSDMPNEIKAIGSSLLAISQNIEKLRSDKTDFHGKTKEDYKIEDSIYTYFIINSVTTIGLFLRSYYKANFPENLLETSQSILDDDELPF